MSQSWQVVVQEHDLIGEGPVWDASRRSLLWTDIAGRRIHRWDPASGAIWTRRLEQMAGAVLPRARGGMAFCLQDGVWLSDTDAGDLHRLVAVEPDEPNTRLNDVKTDRAGRLWGGTMALDARSDAGALYRIDGGGNVTAIDGPTTISNGIDWSPDGSLMYYIDSATHRLDVFDFDLVTGSAEERRPLVRFEASMGLPDGMSVDGAGGLWVAFYDGWAVHRFTPDGVLDRTVTLPIQRPTSCCFGGADLDLLYVTSARDGLTEAELREQPLAGAVFVVEPGVTGSVVTAFAG